MKIWCFSVDVITQNHKKKTVRVCVCVCVCVCVWECIRRHCPVYQKALSCSCRSSRVKEVFLSLSDAMAWTAWFKSEKKVIDVSLHYLSLLFSPLSVAPVIHTGWSLALSSNPAVFLSFVTGCCVPFLFLFFPLHLVPCWTALLQTEFIFCYIHSSRYEVFVNCESKTVRQFHRRVRHGCKSSLKKWYSEESSRMGCQIPLISSGFELIAQLINYNFFFVDVSCCGFSVYWWVYINLWLPLS